MSRFTLRPYQLAALDAIGAAATEGVRRQLAVLATGLGKTVVFSHLRSHLGLPGRVLVLAHREELLDQAASKIMASNPGIRVGIEQGGRRATTTCEYVVASVATIGRYQAPRLLRLDPSKFSLVITDEAHHGVAPSYLNVFEHFGILRCERDSDNKVKRIHPPESNTHPLLVGVTATPERADKVGLASVFDRVVYEMHLRDGIEQGWLARVRAWRVDTDTNLSRVHTRAGDYAQDELAREVDTEYRNELAVKCYLDRVSGRRAVAFCVNVEHAHHMAAAFEAHGVPSEAVWGEMPKDRRKAVLRRLSTGETLVVCNCAVLTEGFDEPGIEAVIMARPTQSASLYLQMLGRGTRLSPGTGKTHLTVIDLADTTRHDLPSAANLLGLPPRWQSKGEDLLEEGDALKKVAEQAGPAAVQGELWKEAVSIEHARKLMREVDILAGTAARKELGDITRFSWLLLPDESFHLSLPDRRGMVVREDLLGQWHVLREDRDLQIPMAFTCPTRDAAIAVADRFVQAAFPGAIIAIDLDARWRRQPASEGQQSFLQRVRRWREGMSRGEASDAIAAFKSRRGVAEHVH